MLWRLISTSPLILYLGGGEFRLIVMRLARTALPKEYPFLRAIELLRDDPPGMESLVEVRSTWKRRRSWRGD